MKALLCSLLSLASASALAAPPIAKPYYAGLAVGHSHYDDGASFEDLNVSRSKAALKLYGGYHFSPYIAAEISLTNLGEHEASANSVDIDSHFSALMFTLIGQYPISSALSTYGQLGMGVMSVHQEFHYITTDLALAEHEKNNSDFALTAGAGISYYFKPITVRLGWQRYFHNITLVTARNGFITSVDETQHMDLVYLGLNYRF